MSGARDAGESFVPALGKSWLTPLYDSVAMLSGERFFKRRLLENARIRPGHDVLDLGCGTGTLALMAKAVCRQARVHGLDRDPEILSIARRKVAVSGSAITLHEGSATSPPFADGSFDRVLTTLMLHHLTTPQKREALSGALRILRPGGELHIADWGKPHNLAMRVAAMIIRYVDGAETTAANLDGQLQMLVEQAGFVDVEETQRWMTPFGTLVFLRAVRR